LHAALDDGAPETVAGRKPLVIDLPEGLEMLVQQAPQVGGLRVAGAVQREGLDARDGHDRKGTEPGMVYTKHLDVLAYNVLLHRTYRVPVHSTVLLLRQQAQHPNLTGRVQYAARPGRGKMDFSFEVVSLWEIPADDLLQGPLATLPLAVLGWLPDSLRLTDALAAVVKRLAQRLQQDAAGEQAERLLTAAYILTGLRLPKQEDVSQLFRGVSIAMRESVTYQAILEEGRIEGREEGREEGRVEELHRTILRQGRERFGEADQSVCRDIEAIADVDALEELSLRLLKVSSWAELLARPSA
jgi:hypothetical protein